MFKVGDIAVYPAHGVVKVKGIEVKEICGTKKKFFILKVVENDVTVMVPTDNAKTIGLRHVIDSEEISKIYQILSKKENSSGNGHKSWNKRYREYAERLKSGSIFEVAAVLKDIYLLQNEKELSFGERRIMDTARALLIKEISISKNSEEELVAGEIDNLLNQ
ncbi:MAG TPA: CarD family transcriptional regulator [Thermodesulfobacteriota bacterium]|nr:CarD family transcriptional regulator [Thermodesulfobacteriota bacterium]